MSPSNAALLSDMGPPSPAAGGKFACEVWQPSVRRLCSLQVEVGEWDEVEEMMIRCVNGRGSRSGGYEWERGYRYEDDQVNGAADQI